MVESAFQEASASYDSLVQWDVAAAGTLDAAALRPGEMVLDVCCGTGSTALPAASAVLPGGRVLGVDLTEAMLERARSKQLAQGVENVEFERRDMTVLPYPVESFDVVICQLGIFFVEDVQAQVTRLWSLVRPGGRLVLTTFQGQPNQPVGPALRAAFEAEGGELVQQAEVNRTNDADRIRELLLDAGTSDPIVSVQQNWIPLSEPEDFWTMLMGGGIRGQIDRLGAGPAARVHDRVIDWIRDNEVKQTSWDLIFTVAHK